MSRWPAFSTPITIYTGQDSHLELLTTYLVFTVCDASYTTDLFDKIYQPIGLFVLIT